MYPSSVGSELEMIAVDGIEKDLIEIAALFATTFTGCFLLHKARGRKEHLAQGPENVR